MGSEPSTSGLPRWLKRNVPKGDAGQGTARLLDELRLATVCRHARCPNRMECYAQKTATFMVLGDVCTRGCRFCGVTKGQPRPVTPTSRGAWPRPPGSLGWPTWSSPR